VGGGGRRQGGGDSYVLKKEYRFWGSKKNSQEGEGFREIYGNRKNIF